MTGVALLVLVFLSTIESAYESLSEVSLKVLSGEREDHSDEVLDRPRRTLLLRHSRPPRVPVPT